MKNIVLLAILVSTLVFSSWWHEDVTDSNARVLTLQDMTTRSKVIGYASYLKEDWECALSSPCQLQCQQVFIIDNSRKYYTYEYINVADPQCDDAKLFEYITTQQEKTHERVTTQGE